MRNKLTFLAQSIGDKSVHRRQFIKRDGRNLFLYGYQPHTEPPLKAVNCAGTLCAKSGIFMRLTGKTVSLNLPKQTTRLPHQNQVVQQQKFHSPILSSPYLKTNLRACMPKRPFQALRPR